MRSAKTRRAAAGVPGAVVIGFVYIFVFVLLAGTVAAQPAENGFELRVEAPARVTAGDRFDVTLRGGSSLDLLGYAAHLTYDPELVTLVPTANEAFFSGTVWEEADFLIATDDPAAGALIVGVILDQDQEGEGGRVVSAGGDLQFLNVRFRASEVESATTTTIGFAEDIDGTLLADSELAGHDTASDLTLVPATIEIVLPGTTFVRGDCNGDGDVTGAVTDAVFLLEFGFLGGPEPPCLAACDANGDGDVSGQVSDAVYLLLFNFMGGPAPAAPFPDCGPGELPTDEELGCEGSPEACA